MPGNGEIGIIIGDNRFTCRKAVRSAFAPACENRARGNRSLSRFAVMNGRISPDRDGTDADSVPGPAGDLRPCGGVEGIVDALRDSGRQQEIALVCHGPLSDSELALIDGTIDIMLNHRLDEFAAVTLRAMADAASRPHSEVISLPQPFDIITKENM